MFHVSSELIRPDTQMSVDGDLRIYVVGRAAVDPIGPKSSGDPGVFSLT